MDDNQPSSVDDFGDDRDLPVVIVPPSLPVGQPALPVEIYATIIEYVEDKSTLATCCRVSHLLLQVASRVLYREVVVDGLERLGQLFCQRVSPSSQSFSLGVMQLCETDLLRRPTSSRRPRGPRSSTRPSPSTG